MKKFKILAIALISALSLNSCLVDDEVASQDLAESGYAVGFNQNNFSYPITPGQANIEESIYVDLLGGNGAKFASTDIVVRSVVNTTLSTAIEGTHFKINNTSNEFTIAAGQALSNQKFNIEVLTDGIAVGENLTIVIDLEPVTGNNIVTNQLTMDLAKCDPPLAGAFVVANFNDADDSSYTANGNPVNVIALDCANNYQMDRLPPVGAAFWVNFSHDPITNAIEITDWELEGTYALTAQSASATFDVSGNVIAISFGGLALDGITWYNNISFDLVP